MSRGSTRQRASAAAMVRSRPTCVLSWTAEKNSPRSHRGRDPAAPRVELAAGFLGYPLAERHDRPGPVRDGDELRRADQAAHGMLPAHQHLDPDQAAGGEMI